MKVLFICLDYFPYSGACTSLLDKMFRIGNLKEQLGEVHVLTVKHRYDENDTQSIGGITVHRCFPLSQYTKKEIAKLLFTNPILAIHTVTKKVSSIYKKIFLKKDILIRSDVKNTLVRKLKQLNAEAYDVIIPVCGAHEAVDATIEYLKNNSAKMVVYQVDPCATNRGFSNGLRKAATTFEQKMYDTASAIITTPILYRYICETYPAHIINKSIAMEFPNVDTNPVEASPRQSEEYKCVYAGSIYSIARDPKYTMDVFNLLKNTAIKLHFVGVEEKQIYSFVERGSVGERFLFHGKLPLEKARKEIGEADILVNIGNIMTNQVPSKIFEYISACKPIVNICASPDCPSIAYLEKYPLAISVVAGVGTPEEHAQEIEEFILKCAGQSMDKQDVIRQFMECTPHYCANQMSQVIKSVLSEGNN